MERCFADRGRRLLSKLPGQLRSDGWRFDRFVVQFAGSSADAIKHLIEDVRYPCGKPMLKVNKDALRQIPEWPQQLQ